MADIVQLGAPDADEAGKKAELRQLYTFLDVVVGDPDAGPTVSWLVERRAVALHPPGQIQLAETTIVDGSSFWVDLSERIGRFFYYGSHHEDQEGAIFRRICLPGSEIWDVGANLGLYSIIAARAVEPGGRVRAFEPNSKARGLLEKNIKANQLTNVEVEGSAVADFDGDVLFHQAADSAFSGISDTGRSKIESVRTVPAVRLDTIWRNAGERPVDVLKIDVEGHEAAVFAGARHLIAGSPDLVVMCEFSRKNLDEAGVAAYIGAMAALEGDGFVIWCIDKATVSTAIPSGSLEAALNVRGGLNLWITRDGSAGEQRFRQALSGLPSHEEDAHLSAIARGTGVLVRDYEAMLGQLNAKLQRSNARADALLKAHEKLLRERRSLLARLKDGDN